MLRKLTVLMALGTLVACGGGDGLRTLDGGTSGPDEFSVLPAQPLIFPETNALPVPTPGQSNPADPNPRAQAVVALGGRPQGLAGGVPASDSALVAQASRFGVSADVRTLVAQEDAAVRGRAGGLRLTGGDRYFAAYARQALDAYAALGRFRAAGVDVPSAPPAP